MAITARPVGVRDLFDLGFSPDELDRDNIKVDPESGDKIQGVDGMRYVSPRGGPSETEPLGPTGNQQRFILYDQRGQQRIVQAAKVGFLLRKRDARTGKPVFYTYPPVVLERPFSCLSKLRDCPKMFVSEFDRDQHFRFRHRKEFERLEEERERDWRAKQMRIQEESLEAQRQLVEALKGTGLSPEDVLQKAAGAPSAAVLTQPDVSGTPNETWEASALKDYIAEKGWPVPEVEKGHYTEVRRTYLTYIEKMEAESGASE